MDRISFLNGISGIDYPEMIVHFFDHFIALKQIAEGSVIETISHTDQQITFKITFSNPIAKNTSLNVISISGGQIVIYGKPIFVNIVSTDELAIIINLNGAVL